MFWDLFGYGDPESANVWNSNTCPQDPEAQCFETADHEFTEGVGYMIYGLYHILVMLVLLNMLIALMSNTFSRVQVRGKCAFSIDILTFKTAGRQ